jgi:hypothetical protein
MIAIKVRRTDGAREVTSLTVVAGRDSDPGPASIGGFHGFQAIISAFGLRI